MRYHEVNFDGLVGPTHHYGGLSPGNVASQRHAGWRSSPRQAAIEGLSKMRRLMQLGLPQAMLPPHERPDVAMLRTLGFTGPDERVLAQTRAHDPALLACCASASAMWTANAATVSPSPDTADARVHLTPANLTSQFHRSLETATTSRILAAIFADEQHFALHPPMPAGTRFADEGAANHMRLAPAHGEAGVNVLVFGRDVDDAPGDLPQRYPARQSRAAHEAIARRHGLTLERTLFIRQNPRAIDAGAFHNDVVAVANENVLLIHEHALADQHQAIDTMRAALQHTGGELRVIELTSDAVDLDTAVQTYLFNSQLVTLPGGETALLCPAECAQNAQTAAWLEHATTDAHIPIDRVIVQDVRQSMRNGGGPACLRLRVVLSDAELAAAHHGVFLTETLHDQLATWIERHYRDELTGDDLADPKLLEESRTALDELTQLLGLGNIYPFQQ